MLALGVASVMWIFAMQAEGMRREEERAPVPEGEFFPAATRHEFDGEFFRTLPLIGHRYQDMLALAPGVSDPDADGRLNVHGAREGGVEWRLDGAEITDPRTSDAALGIDPMVIDRLEIVTAGAPASRGRALGGFSNVVTRGGGNDLSGAVTLYWRGRFLDGDGAGNQDMVRFDTPPPEFHDARLTAGLGGAIAKDHLWWYASVARLEVEDPTGAWNVDPVISSRGTFTFGRVTWQADPANTLTFQLAASPRRYEGLGIDVATSPDSGFVLDTTSRASRLGWKSFSPSGVLLEASLSRLDSGQDVDPESDDFEAIETQVVENSLLGDNDQALYPCEQINCSEALGEDRVYRINAYTGYASGPWYYRSRDDRRLDTVRADVSAVVEAGHGTHHLRGGFEAGRERALYATMVNPILYDATSPGFSPDPNSPAVTGFQVLEVFTPGENPHEITGSYGALYLSDSFKPWPNLSLTAGVRLDGEEMDFPGYEPFDPGVERRRSVELWRAVCEEAALQVPLGPFSNCYPLTPYDGQPPSGFGQSLQTYVDRDGDGDNDVPDSIVALDLNKDGRFSIGGLEGLELYKHFTLADERVPGRFTLDAAHVSPRLGIAWDPSRAGRWKLFGTWGRYHDRFHAESALGEAAGESASFTFVPVNGRIRPGAASRTAPTRSIVQVDHDMKPARMDELSLGAECNLPDEWRVGVTYVHRSTEGLTQDADLNHFTCRQSGSAIGIDPVALCGDPNGVLHTDLFGGVAGFPGSGVSNGLEDLYAHSPAFNRVLRVQALDVIEDDSWELTVVRPMRRNWQMRAGYTLSRARGEAADAFSFTRDDVSVAPRRRTPLDHDQRHSLEVQAAARLPRGVTLATAIRWDSGSPYTVVEAPEVDLDSMDNVVPRLLLPTGAMNDQRNEGRWRVDARIEKGFRIRKVTASAFLTVVNLLDDDSLTLTGYTQHGFAEGYRDFGRRFEIGTTVGF